MKWFTYCQNRVTRNQWGYYGNRHSRDSRVGLLFGTDNGEPLTDEDRLNIENDKDIHEFFGGVFLMIDYADGTTIVTPDEDYLGTPDKANIDETPVAFYAYGKRYSVQLHQRYNACRSLLKAVGCSNCPEKGMVCLRRSMPELPDETSSVNHDEERAKEILKHKETKFAGFTFASPVMTKEEHFEPSLRGYDKHDFSHIEQWSASRSKASKRAHASKAFKKKHCPTCPISSNCRNYRWCEGPYPSEEKMVEHILKEWAPRIEAWQGPDWQLWKAALCAGRTNVMDRYNTIFSGPVWHNGRGQWELVAHRAKTHIEVYARTESYEEAAKWYGLPPDNNYVEGVTDLAKALWLNSQAMHSRTFSGGFGGKHRTVVARELNPTGIRIHWGGPRSLAGRNEIENFAEYWSLSGDRINVPRIAVER